VVVECGSFAQLEQRVREAGFLATRKKRQRQRRLPSPSRRRAIRVRAGVSLEEMGGRVGVSGEAVRLWELGRRPSEAHLAHYLDVLADLRAR
jgi:DNA-binding transcriptional regulator YiaG